MNMKIQEVSEASLKIIKDSVDSGVANVSEALFVRKDMINLVYGRPDVVNYARIRRGRALNILGAGEVPQIRGYSSEEAMYIPTSFNFANTYKIAYSELSDSQIIDKLDTVDGKFSVAVKNKYLLFQKILDLKAQAAIDMQNTIKNILHGVFNGTTNLSNNSQPIVLTSNATTLASVPITWANNNAKISNDMGIVSQLLSTDKIQLYGTVIDDHNKTYLYNNLDLQNSLNLMSGGNVVAQALKTDYNIFGELVLSNQGITEFRNAQGQSMSIIDRDFAYYLPRQFDGLPVVEIIINAPKNKPNITQFDSQNGMYIRTQSNIQGIAEEIGGEYVPTFETAKEECIELTVGASISVVENTKGIRRQRIIL